MISPLGLLYRWNPRACCLEAACPEDVEFWGDGNYPDAAWRASRVPGLQLMFATPGEVECAIAARDAAVTEAMGEPELVGVVQVGGE